MCYLTVNRCAERSAVNCLVLPDSTKMSDVSEYSSFVHSAAGGLPLMVDSEPLTFTLTPVVASQLVQMFGPSSAGVKPFNPVNV